MDAWAAAAAAARDRDNDNDTCGKNQPSLSKIKYQEQKQQRDEYVKKEVEKITKQYGFQSGARHTMETMKRYSDYFKSRYFSDAKTGNPVKDISIPEMERVLENHRK